MVSLAEIEAGIEAVKHLGPIVDAVVGAVKNQIPQEKADAEAIKAAIEKGISDIKGGIEAIIAAAKAAA